MMFNNYTIPSEHAIYSMIKYEKFLKYLIKILSQCYYPNIKLLIKRLLKKLNNIRLLKVSMLHSQ